MKFKILKALVFVVFALSSANSGAGQGPLPGAQLESARTQLAPALPVKHLLTFESLEVGYTFSATNQPYESIGVIIPEDGSYGIVGIPEIIGAYTSPGTRHALRNKIESEFSSDGEDLEIKLDGYTSNSVTVHVGRDFVAGYPIDAVLEGYFVSGDVYELVDQDTATIPNAITAPTIPLTVRSAIGAINFIRISYGIAQEPEIVDDIEIQVWQGDPPELVLTPDETAPDVHITHPLDGSTTSTLSVTGFVDEDRAWNRRVTITTPVRSWDVHVSNPVVEEGQQRFYYGALVELNSGTNLIQVTAVDQAGNTGTTTVTVNYSPPEYPEAPPDWPDTLDIVVRRSDCWTDCGMEVTQGIQGWEQIGPTPYSNNNKTPLVAGKTTLVRVYAELLGMTDPVESVAAELRAYSGSVELPGSPIYSINRVTLTPSENYGQQRSDPSKSFNFLLPPGWTEEGTIRLRATVNYGQNPPEGLGHYDTANSAVYDVSFKESEVFCIYLNRFHSTKEGDVTPTWSEVFENLELTRLIYPVSPDKIEIHIGNTYATGRYLDTGNNARDDENLSRLAHEFRRALGLYYGLAYAGCGNTVFLGLTDDTVRHRGITTAYRPVSVSVAHDTEFFTMKTAHEIGHSQGLGHVEGTCDGQTPAPPFESYPTYRNAISGSYYFDQSIGDWGVNIDLAGNSFTTRSPEVDGDMMSYCQESWMSVYTWKWLYNYFTDGEYGALAFAPAPEPAAITAPPAPYLIVGGWVHESVGLLAPTWTQMLAAGSSDHVGTGPYTLKLLDNSNTVLFTRHFSPEQIIDLESYTTFREVLPAIAGTVKIQLSGGSLPAPISLGAGSHKPHVTLISPNGGENWDATGSREIYWSSEDLDDDPLFYTVFYSADNGANWTVVASDLQQPGKPLVLDELPGCTNQCLIRVAVSDGINSSMDTSDAPFTKQGQPPIVTILNPRPVTVFDYASPIFFEALVADWDEKAIPEQNLVWTSDVDGALGSGYTISKNRMSPGLHQITLTVTDSSGLQATDTTSVFITPTSLIYLPMVRKN